MPSGKLWRVMNVCVHASFLAIFIRVLDRISQTQGEIVLLCNISSLYNFTSPPRSPICLSPSLLGEPPECCKCDGKRFVCVCVCARTGQRKGRCLKPGYGFGEWVEKQAQILSVGAALNELHCSLIKQLHSVRYTV